MTPPSAARSKAIASSQRTGEVDRRLSAARSADGVYPAPPAELPGSGRAPLDPARCGEARVALRPRRRSSRSPTRVAECRCPAPAPPPPIAATPPRSQTALIGCSSRNSTWSVRNNARRRQAATPGWPQPRFDHLQVKAAKLVPGEAVERPHRVRVAVFRQRTGRFPPSPSPAG